MHNVENHNTEKDGLVTNLQVNCDFGTVILLLKGSPASTDPPPSGGSVRVDGLTTTTRHQEAW